MTSIYEEGLFEVFGKNKLILKNLSFLEHNKI